MNLEQCKKRIQNAINKINWQEMDKPVVTDELAYCIL